MLFILDAKNWNIICNFSYIGYLKVRRTFYKHVFTNGNKYNNSSCFFFFFLEQHSNFETKFIDKPDKKNVKGWVFKCTFTIVVAETIFKKLKVHSFPSSMVTLCKKLLQIATLWSLFQRENKRHAKLRHFKKQPYFKIQPHTQGTKWVVYCKYGQSLCSSCQYLGAGEVNNSMLRREKFPAYKAERLQIEVQFLGVILKKIRLIIVRITWLQIEEQIVVTR